MEEKEKYNNEYSSYSRCIRYPDKADKPDGGSIEERVQKRVLKTFSGFSILEILKTKIEAQKHRREAVLLSKIAFLIVNGCHCQCRQKCNDPIKPYKFCGKKIRYFAYDVKAKRNIKTLDYESTCPSITDLLSDIFDKEKIWSLHIKEIPVRQKTLCHSLSDQDKECRIKSPAVLCERCC